MPISQFGHNTVRAQDLEVSARFYSEVMGLRDEAVGAFEFFMRIMFCGGPGHAIVHLLGAGDAHS